MAAAAGRRRECLLDHLPKQKVRGVVRRSGRRQRVGNSCRRRVPTWCRSDAHRRIVLDLVTRHAGSTGHELWSLASADEREELEDHHEIYRKLSDLRHAGKVIQGDPRDCTVRHTRMVTWQPTP
jgi:hypothetical protein